MGFQATGDRGQERYLTVLLNDAKRMTPIVGATVKSFVLKIVKKLDCILFPWLYSDHSFAWNARMRHDVLLRILYLRYAQVKRIKIGLEKKRVINTVLKILILAIYV